MKEVKKCSISGIAFTMEADAFQVLSRYLESLNDTYRNTDGGKEIVEGYRGPYRRADSLAPG